ncbi:MAG: Nramp family divalent metal transporter [Bacteroidota bacterium]
MGDRLKRFFKVLGPGILFASTCIGVSHLVQSTRAGADYGFMLLGAIILANIFKYPFFEFAVRYTSATGDSVIDGYARKGKWIVWTFFIISIPSMVIVTAAVTFVSSGLLGNLLGINLPTNIWAISLFIVSVLILAIGRYKLLDNLLKLVGLVLLLSTLVAFVSALMHGPVEQAPTFEPRELYSISGIMFAIALMGWMPTAVDLSAWTSLWVEAKVKTTGYRPTLKESLADFNFGYIISAVLSLFFLTLGAYIIHGTGTELSNNSAGFANQLITMFTTAIGQWSYTIIAIAAFSTMFSTTIMVVDGYGRAMNRTFKLMTKGLGTDDSRKSYIIWTVIITVTAYLVISQFLNNLKSLVDLATILSFVIAPLAGLLNYIVIRSDEIHGKFRLPKWLNLLAIAGLVFLTVFTIIFFAVWFMPGWFESTFL